VRNARDVDRILCLSPFTRPGGRYDGTFTADYEYVPGMGDLDECNGRRCITPDFPQGTYAYFLTEDWPVIPRRYRGTPSADFFRRRMCIRTDTRCRGVSVCRFYSPPSTCSRYALGVVPSSRWKT
jgi:hypothetical protein